VKRAIACLFLLFPPAREASAQASPPKFELASVKKALPGRGVIPWDATRRLRLSPGGRLELRYISLMDLLGVVFRAEPFQISGPQWLATEYFDISAIAPPDAGNEQIPSMLQDLLAERFNLRFRRETQSSPVYALVVAPGGAKLNPPVPDDAPDAFGAIDPGTRTNVPKGPAATASARTWFGIYRLTSANGVVHYEFPNMSMQNLAQFFTPRGGRGPLDLPVLDMTNLDGRFQVFLEISLNEVHGRSVQPAGEGEAAEPRPDLIRLSLARQGIHLVRRSVPLEKIVIERIERSPTPN
jgi:uncharacterized protein (TIGR03435 family)